MTNKYILVDFENVQPKNLALLAGHDLKLIVFLGANQEKITVDFAAKMQSLGGKASYRQISGNGPNALDLHIAFYIGELAAKDTDAEFHIISGDKGFDPLVAHLRGRKISTHRNKGLSEINLLKTPETGSLEVRVADVLKNLKARGASRPAKVKTLKSCINASFNKSLNDAELTGIVSELEKRNHIKTNDQSVSYGATITGVNGNSCALHR